MWPPSCFRASKARLSRCLAAGTCEIRGYSSRDTCSRRPQRSAGLVPGRYRRSCSFSFLSILPAPLLRLIVVSVARRAAICSAHATPGRPPLRPGPPEPRRLGSAAAERGAFCVRGIPETRSCNFHGRRLHGAADARCSDVCRSVVCRSAARSAASSSLAALLELEAELHERRRLLISTAHPRAAAALKGASCISRHQACSSCTRGPLRGIRAARSKVEAHSFI